MDHYKGCFKTIYIIARTARLDHSYMQLCEWAERHLKQDDKQEPFVFTCMDDEVLIKIFNAHAQLVAKEKVQRKQHSSKEAPIEHTICIYI